MTAKNSTENSTGDTAEVSGAIDISYVVAAVRGIASMGPIHKMIALISTADGMRPMCPVICSGPLLRKIANSAIIARPMSAMK